MEKSPVLLHIQGSYDINEIDGGWSHSLLLMSDGSLAQMGRKIATGFDHDVSSPVLIDVNLVEGSVTEQASCGRSHNAIGTDDGKVYTWGNNFFGQLGHGDRMDRKTPMIVELKTQVMIRDIACGYDFTCALGDCQLFTWGSGKYGVLGHGDEKDRLSPCLIEDLDSITGMACGGHHVLAWVIMCQRMLANGEIHESQRNSFTHGGSTPLGSSGTETQNPLFLPDSFQRSRTSTLLVWHVERGTA